MVLLYKLLVPTWVSFEIPFVSVSNTIITDATFKSALTTFPGNINLAINYTFAGVLIIITVYLVIVAIKREGETYYS
jgi:predicted dinucleotide-utilizing enzyme